MSDVVKDAGRIWDRLFDHKGFLAGEITFVLQEFEQKRKDKEVDLLFRAIENITEIKDTEINRSKQAIHGQLDTIFENLNQVRDFAYKFTQLETKYKEDSSLEHARDQRKIEWNTFMDNVMTTYAEINSSYEVKELESSQFYEDIEKKLLI